MGCSSSVCVRAKFPQTEKLGVLVVCSISSSSSVGVKALLTARSATRSVMWSNIGVYRSMKLVTYSMNDSWN